MAREGGPDGELAAVEDAARRLAAQLSSGSSPLAAVTTAQELARLVDHVMRLSVDRARAAGHTWQELGEVLGTTRQAAFQRFGRPIDPRTGTPEPPLPGAADRAVELLADIVEGRWARARRDFDATVAANLDEARLSEAWARVMGLAGPFVRLGTPRAYVAGAVTVVDIPLTFETAQLTGRVAYDRAGKVAGLHFLPPTALGGPGRATGG